MRVKLTYNEVVSEQRSPEWFAARLGVLTGSAASDMVDTIKSGESAKRRDLRIRLAVERLTERVYDETDLSRIPHVQRGIELEPFARMALEERTGLLFAETGFLRANELPVGCSLDGHIGPINAIEEIVDFKCPKTSTHLAYLEAGKLPSAYEPQAMHNLWVSGAKVFHFFSYDDRLPGKLACFHLRVNASDLPMDDYIEKALQFLKEVEDLHLTLKRKAA